MFKRYNRSNQQLVAHCFFTAGQVKYSNYDDYYHNKEEQHASGENETNY